MKITKVALIHNIISPYRIPLFAEIATDPSIDLFVYFTSKSEKNREWDVNIDESFNYKVLSGTAPNISKEAFYHINPSIIKELMFGKYDVIISAGYSSFSNQIAFFIAKLLNVPFILWSGSTKNEPSRLRRLSLPLIKFIIKHSDSFIAYGTNAKEYLMQLGAPENKIFISYNTVDTSFFARESELVKNNKDLKKVYGYNHEYLILYSGQLIERKGLRYLLEAHKNLIKKHDVGLLIVGNGDQISELMQLCKNNNINKVYFVGFVQKQNLPKYYALADIFVLPSVEEVWGLVINEAMACSLPIVTTKRVGAAIDLVEDGINGFVVNEKNAVELEDALNKILSDQSLKDEMSNKSKEIIFNHFTIKHSSKGFLDAISCVNK
ncbi:glycosyltransferase family 4 protein [Methanohalophilus sp. WG1-DM]|uniref:glycosyltransferase family 4 protein n=1 Tax=Methanohalophilus sp. WG1-DM TaxID=2491675 RepID=UPI000FFE47FB|nr:glycosyltransferase family 4 protein [Methanohalophilus sp. WG1-DM]RXG33523.1 group 1 glycosyl transferase [Methanohalophilus sp. WG1-DM]